METGNSNQIRTKYATYIKLISVVTFYALSVIFYILYFYYSIIKSSLEYAKQTFQLGLQYIKIIYKKGNSIKINLSIKPIPIFSKKQKQTKLSFASNNIMSQNIRNISGKSKKTYHNLVEHQKKSRGPIKTLLIFIFFPLYATWKIFGWLITIEFKFKPFSFTTIALLILFTSGFIFSTFYLSILDELPDVNSLQYFDPKQTTHIYDRKGNLLYRTYQDEDRYFVKVAEIPDVIKQATIASEDVDFYDHFGLSIKGIVRAAKKNYFEEDLQGGSTITQQLVKNTLLTSERTFTRKIKEAVLAIEMERRFTKDQILEMYLNKISYGGTSYGIKSAARKYFGKDLGELNVAEASFLAGLPASPSNYSPLTNDLSVGKARQRDVLNLMVSAGYLSPEQADTAYNEELNFVAKGEIIKAPHFVNYVISELEKRYGQQMISQGGLEVYTTIDMDLQNQMQQIISKDVSDMTQKYNVTNGAGLVTNPATGEILAMVGSVNYWDDKNDGQVNVATSLRQPGSSIKPITYALAFENGYSPFDMIDDSPISFPIPNEKPYTPENYDGGFHGRVTLKTALANSYNIPAVKLLDKLGVNNFIDFATSAGITSFSDKNRFGLAITLGGGEVKMVDMATAYSMFPNGGYRVDVDPIIRVYDRYGKVVYENGCAKLSREEESMFTHKIISSNYQQSEISGFDNCERTRIISPSSSYYISNILSDNNARLSAFGYSNNLGIKEKQVAVKTGTTQNLKDNWAIGYTNNYMVITWIGNNDGAQMKNIASGYSSASKLWRDTFDYIIKTRNVPEKLDVPEDMEEILVCPYTNTLACDGCPNIKRLYVKGTEPKRRCNAEEVNKVLESIKVKTEPT